MDPRQAGQSRNRSKHARGRHLENRADEQCNAFDNSGDPIPGCELLGRWSGWLFRPDQRYRRFQIIMVPR